MWPPYSWHASSASTQLDAMGVTIWKQCNVLSDVLIRETPLQGHSDTTTIISSVLLINQVNRANYLHSTPSEGAKEPMEVPLPSKSHSKWIGWVLNFRFLLVSDLRWISGIHIIRLSVSRWFARQPVFHLSNFDAISKFQDLLLSFSLVYRKILETLKVRAENGEILRCVKKTNSKIARLIFFFGRNFAPVALLNPPSLCFIGQAVFSVSRQVIICRWLLHN